MGQQIIQKKLLVIEDCASDVWLLERMLGHSDGKNSIGITSVPRLTDAFRLIDDEWFDVILLDLNLLDIDGVASVAALHAEVPDVPIIVYSGMQDRKMRESAMLCGAHDYLIKGEENMDSLRYAIRSAIN